MQFGLSSTRHAREFEVLFDAAQRKRGAESRNATPHGSWGDNLRTNRHFWRLALHRHLTTQRSFVVNRVPSRSPVDRVMLTASGLAKEEEISTNLDHLREKWQHEVQNACWHCIRKVQGKHHNTGQIRPIPLVHPRAIGRLQPKMKYRDSPHLSDGVVLCKVVACICHYLPC